MTFVLTNAWEARARPTLPSQRRLRRVRGSARGYEADRGGNWGDHAGGASKAHGFATRACHSRSEASACAVRELVRGADPRCPPQTSESGSAHHPEPRALSLPPCAWSPGTLGPSLSMRGRWRTVQVRKGLQTLWRSPARPNARGRPEELVPQVMTKHGKQVSAPREFPRAMPAVCALRPPLRQPLVRVAEAGGSWKGVGYTRLLSRGTARSMHRSHVGRPGN